MKAALKEHIPRLDGRAFTVGTLKNRNVDGSLYVQPESESESSSEDEEEGEEEEEEGERDEEGVDETHKAKNNSPSQNSSKTLSQPAVQSKKVRRNEQLSGEVCLPPLIQFALISSQSDEAPSKKRKKLVVEDSQETDSEDEPAGMYDGEDMDDYGSIVASEDEEEEDLEDSDDEE